MKQFFTSILRRYPTLENWIQRLLLTGGAARDSERYWEARYARGGNSGSGSSGHRADFKARFLNQLVVEHEIESVLELGCGDGEQLALAQYPRYVGLDVSPTAIQRCKERFADDPTRSFFLYDGEKCTNDRGPLSADLALSLDVIYHIIDDDNYERYLGNLFQAATRFVVIYSSDCDRRVSAHVRDREFSPDVARRFPGWKLVRHQPNPYPTQQYGREGSDADFFVYRRQAAGEHS